MPIHTHVQILLSPPAWLLEYLLYCNVGHHFKLIFCMSLAELETKNQVLDYLLVLIPALKTNAVANIRLDNPGWRSDILIKQKGTEP